MKLTTFTDYSLRVLIYLAAQPEKRATISEIARAFDVSENHLTKVVHLLGKNKWLANVRGKGGGLELAMPPELVGVGTVIRETEGAAVVAKCFAKENNDCAIARSCGLRGVLAEAVEAFYTVLDRYTLADLVRNRQALAKVLFMDQPVTAPAARALSRK